MKTLAHHLIEKIHPDISPLWAVADSDGLFRSEEVALLLRELGAEIHLHEEAIAFRYLYEHLIRPQLESSTPGCHIIVYSPEEDASFHLPPDIHEKSHHLEVTLRELFPSLALRVIRQLEPENLSRLWDQRNAIPNFAHSERETQDIVLRLCYRFDPALIEDFQDLVHFLIEFYTTGQRLPDILARRLEEATPGFRLSCGKHSEMVRKPEKFWNFIQNNWDQWVDPPKNSILADSPSATVDFTEDRIRRLVDNLFDEGFLNRLKNLGRHVSLPAEWCRVGIVEANAGFDLEGLQKHRAELLTESPGEEAGHKEWSRFAQRYASHVATTFTNDIPPQITDSFWKDFWEPIDENFRTFSQQRLESLANLPPTRPVMLHHIAPFLSRRVTAGKKVALLVLDGLSLSQWKVLQEALEEEIPGLLATEDSCFGILPSLTNVCRQSIYSGKLPFFFQSSIDRTNADRKGWRDFWAGTTPHSTSAELINIKGEQQDLTQLEETLATGPTALGMTIRMPDEIVHGAKLGWRGVMQQLQLWAKSPFLKEAITSVIDSEYELYLTSDHGNLEVTGSGKIAQGVLVDRSGERCRLYTNQEIAEASESKTQTRAHLVKGGLLPPDYLPLIHSGRGSFLGVNESAVCHGGASLDELVVPFIELSISKTQ